MAYPVLDAHLQDVMRAVKPGCRPHTREVRGCVITTVSWKHWPCLLPQHGPGREHERPIPRWQFVNHSEDVMGICTDTSDLVGVPWRRSGRWTVSVSRREAVATLDDLVGPKR